MIHSTRDIKGYWNGNMDKYIYIWYIGMETYSTRDTGNYDPLKFGTRAMTWPTCPHQCEMEMDRRQSPKWDCGISVKQSVQSFCQGL